MCDPIHTYIHIHARIHIHIHTSYRHKFIDPYAHTLSLTLTYSCQTTFISGPSEIMNCACPFLDYIDCTVMIAVVPVVQHRDANLHTFTYTYTVTHPFLYRDFIVCGH
jgi:hypothetical protein